MSEQSQEWKDKAASTFSAERKEDFVVLVISAITVLLVVGGVIGPKFYKALFF
ncbi:MAG TPA: hypothetical protein VLH56_10385 [Dissulfurispiraceae bacterium]|nr:hypothetical protein [Dissulfurispiraceae bacterium]